jgi:GT2 family glycosyltransferase
MKISVIIAVYGRYKHFYRCLEGVCNGKIKDLEIIVADDGSSGESLNNIKRIIKIFSEKFAIKHVWHEDKGFRKTLILNKAAKESTGELLVFLDCDVVPEPDLLSKYIKYYNKFKTKYNRFFLTGDAVYIGQKISDLILGRRDISYFEAIEIIRKSFDLKTRLSLFYRYVKFFYYKYSGVKYPKGYGGNFAIGKDTFLSVNGFDNTFTMRGEDSDLFKRLVLSGAKRIPVNFSIKAYHLHHERGTEKKDVFDKKRRKRLKWSYYREHPEIIVASNGIREV